MQILAIFFIDTNTNDVRCSAIVLKISDERSLVVKKTTKPVPFLNINSHLEFTSIK